MVQFAQPLALLALGAVAVASSVATQHLALAGNSAIAESIEELEDGQRPVEETAAAHAEFDTP